MFIYKFKSSDPAIINRVTLAGNNLTIYLNKHGQELYSIANRFNLIEDSEGADSLHIWHHSSDNSDAPHVHLRIPTDTNPLTTLRHIVRYMADRQGNKAARENNRQELARNLEEVRVIYGISALPYFSQESIDHFDTETSFLPSDEVVPFLQALDAYQQSTLFTQEALIERYLKRNPPARSTHESFNNALIKVRDLLVDVYYNPEKSELSAALSVLIESTKSHPLYINDAQIKKMLESIINESNSATEDVSTEKTIAELKSDGIITELHTCCESNSPECKELSMTMNDGTSIQSMMSFMVNTLEINYRGVVYTEAKLDARRFLLFIRSNDAVSVDFTYKKKTGSVTESIGANEFEAVLSALPKSVRELLNKRMRQSSPVVVMSNRTDLGMAM